MNRSAGPPLPTKRGNQLQRVPAQLLDISGESMISSAGGSITSWNLAASALYGWQPHEVIGQDLVAILGNYPGAAIDGVETAGIWEGKVERRRRDGSACVVRLRLAKCGNPDSWEWMEVSTDVETTHPAERALDASEYRYRNLFGAVAASFWELDFSGVGKILQELVQGGVVDMPAHLRAHPEISRAMMRATRIIDTNERSLEMFGSASKRELLAASLDTYWPEESTADYTESVISAITRQPRHVAETRMRALDGRVFDALFTVSFLPGTVGGGTLLIGFTDISDRVHAARMLGDVSAQRQMLLDVPTIALCELSAPEVASVFARLRAEGIANLHAFLDENPEFVDFVIANLRVTYLNEAAVQLFGGASAQALIGRNMESIISPGCEVLRRSIEGSYLREPVFQSEMRITRLDGRTLDTLFCRVSNPDPARTDVLVALIDISDQIRARDEVDRMRQQVAHASRLSLLGQLTASMVHEVSQPITAISNNVVAAERLAQQSETPTPRLTGMLALIGQHAFRVGEIIRRLRAVAANREVSMVPISPDEIISETRMLLRQELNEHGVQVGIFKDAMASFVLGDRIQLQQILANLMLNAMQAMETTPLADRRLEVRLSSDQDNVSIEVLDNGPGLSSEFLAAPLQAFRTSKADGLGMGLTICRSIAEAHGGYIDVKDRPDRSGVVATIILPIHAGGQPHEVIES